MPAIASPIVTLSQAKTQLGITVTDLSFDTQLTAFVAAASQMIVNQIGPVAGSPTISEWHDGGSETISLYIDGPVQSVTSVTESFGSIAYTLTNVTLDSGSVATTYGFTADLDAGTLTRRASGAAVPFAAGVKNIHVTAVVGYATTPPDITQAALLLVQHLWDTQRPAQLGRGPIDTSVASYTMPNRVREILDVYNTPGIA